MSKLDDWDKYQSNRIYQPKAERIGIWRSAGWGISDLVTTSTIGIVTAWGLYFWTTFCNLSATQAASILALARIIDAVASLVIGNLTDNLYKTRIGRKFGRRHIFLLFGAPLILESLLFWLPGLNYWYYLITYLLCEVIVASIVIPWEALPNEMTNNFMDRTKMSTTRMTITAVFGTLTTFIQGQLFKIFPQSSPVSFFVNAAIFVTIAVICVLITYVTSWEHFVTKKEYQTVLEEEERVAPKKMTQVGISTAIVRAIKSYFSTFKIKAFRKHLAIYLLAFTAMDAWQAVIVFYIVDVMGMSTTLAANIQALSIVGLPITIISGYLMVKLSPRFLYVTSFVIVIATSICWWLLWSINPGATIFWLYVIGTLFMIGRYIIFFIPWSVFSFIPDLDQLITTTNRTGEFASVMTFVRKSTVALATFLIGVFLDMGGFVNGQAKQPISAQHAIITLITVVVSVLIGLALLVAFTWRLDKNSHKIIVDEVQRLQNGGNPDDATETVKKTCKVLTGIDYENIKDVWRRYQNAD